VLFHAVTLLRSFLPGTWSLKAYQVLLAGIVVCFGALHGREHSHGGVAGRFQKRQLRAQRTLV